MFTLLSLVAHYWVNSPCRVVPATLLRTWHQPSNTTAKWIVEAQARSTSIMTKMPEYTPVPPVLETHRMISSAAWRHMECIITELIFQERDSRSVAILGHRNRKDKCKDRKKAKQRKRVSRRTWSATRSCTRSSVTRQHVTWLTVVLADTSVQTRAPPLILLPVYLSSPHPLQLRKSSSRNTGEEERWRTETTWLLGRVRFTRVRFLGTEDWRWSFGRLCGSYSYLWLL